MIKFEINNLGGPAPVIICDQCEERIKNTKEGVAFYTGSGGTNLHSSRRNEGEIVKDGEIYFTHVDCLPAFEASKKLKTTPTDELRDFLGFLMLNTCFDLENWLDRHKRLRDSGLHN